MEEKQRQIRERQDKKYIIVARKKRK